MVTTWGHDPHFIPIENLLTIINDTLRESPVLIQVNINNEIKSIIFIKLIPIIRLQACNPNTYVLSFPKINSLQNGKFYWYI